MDKKWQIVVLLIWLLLGATSLHSYAEDNELNKNHLYQKTDFFQLPVLGGNLKHDDGAAPVNNTQGQTQDLYLQT